MRLPSNTKFSQPNQLLLVSTGCPSLDELLGGGIAVGSILLIRRDPMDGQYSDLMLRYFQSQALASDPATHSSLIVTDADGDPRSFANSLLHATTIPVDRLTRENDNDEKSSEGGNKTTTTTTTTTMKIAWRYQHQHDGNTANSAVDAKQRVVSKSSFTPRRQPPITNTPGTLGSDNNTLSSNTNWNSNTTNWNNSDNNCSNHYSYCRVFDMQRTLNEAEVDAALNSGRLKLIKSPESLSSLFGLIKTELQSFSTLNNTARQPQSQPRILHLSLHSLASPAFFCLDRRQLVRFLVALRGLLRHSMCTAAISLPDYWWQDGEDDLLRLGDYCIELLPFSGDNQAAYTREYTGWFHLRRVARLNSLCINDKTVAKAVGANLAFRCRRRRFCIEPFHLPPDLTIDGGHHDHAQISSSNNSGGCSTTNHATSNGKLDW